MDEQFSPSVVQGDQLQRDERIRLEALAQAVAAAMGSGQSAEHIVATAQRFERWILGGVG
jgi:hypothetical protein